MSVLNWGLEFYPSQIICMGIELVNGFYSHFPQPLLHSVTFMGICSLYWFYFGWVSQEMSKEVNHMEHDLIRVKL